MISPNNPNMKKKCVTSSCECTQGVGGYRSVCRGEEGRHKHRKHLKKKKKTHLSLLLTKSSGPGAERKHTLLILYCMYVFN